MSDLRVVGECPACDLLDYWWRMLAWDKEDAALWAAHPEGDESDPEGSDESRARKPRYHGGVWASALFEYDDDGLDLLACLRCVEHPSVRP